MATTTTTMAATGHRRSPALVLLSVVILALLSACTPSSAAAATQTTTTTTTRLRGTVYSNVDATFERDHDNLLPPVFPTPPHETGPIVVPCFVSRSHSTPYLEVVRHLAARGYRVILLTDERNAAWIRALYGPDGPFEIAVAPAALTEPSWRRLTAGLEGAIESGRGARALARFIVLMGVGQTEELFPWVRDFMRDAKPSLVVCDLMNEWLVDAAQLAGARVVVTSSGLFPGIVTSDAAWVVSLMSSVPAATLERASFADRVRAAFLEPLDMAAAMLPVASKLNAARARVGLPALVGGPNERIRGRLFLVNSFFGHEIARRLPPYVRFIGPVRSDGNSTLAGEWKAFVDGFKSAGGGPGRLIYLAYGQNCVLTPDRLKGILAALKTLLAEGAIDGAVWSLSMTPRAYLDAAGMSAPGAVPPQIRLTDFAPQKALLASPAVRAFVSHGGAESVSEGVYAAVPMLLAPHFADQPSNAYRLEAAGMALVVPKEGLADSERVAAALRRLLGEPSFGREARRMRALALATARLSTERAADEVEYVLHFGDDHLQDPSERLGVVRRYNLDVWGALLAAVALGVVALGLVGRLVVRVALGGGGKGSGCVGGVCKLPKKRD